VAAIAEPEALRGANHAGFISEQHDEKSAEGEANRLDSNAGVSQLKHGGDTAERQAFEERVDGRRERCPVWFEYGGQGNEEATENAANHPRNSRSRCWRVRKSPGPCGCGHDEEQE
jgi:hypothetical protein